MTVSVVLVPIDESQSLEAHFVSWDDHNNNNNQNHYHNGQSFKQDILRILHPYDDDYLETPLLRPRGNVAGLYAYYNNVPDHHQHQHPQGPQQQEQQEQQQPPNVRATRLAMACGFLSKRFYGPVLLVRSFGGRWENLLVSEILGACCISPDLRPSIQRRVAAGIITTGSVEQDTTTTRINNNGNGDDVPDWLADAAQHNYHDGAELQKVISAMKNPGNNNNNDDDGDDETDDDDDVDDDESSSADHDNDDDDKNDTKTTKGSQSTIIPLPSPTTEFVAKSPLCIHCRRSSSELCQSCQGVYFCCQSTTTTTTTTRMRNCREEGWSHACLCPTWELYAGVHRELLSNFDDFFGEWQTALTSRPHQLGEQPYEAFLRSLGIMNSTTNNNNDNDNDDASPDENNNQNSCTTTSWWRTELGGWAGGQSSSASQVDASVRQSYTEGFAPIVDLPPERRITDEDIERAGLQQKKNAVGLLSLSSWKDYYTLRNIPPTSPVCLLCTFPLTIYRVMEQYGEVPVTVARMLKRPLRIHVVGAEKEMNFLDLFQELAFLLPEDIQLELVFVVREDMLPPKCRTTAASSSGRDKFSMKIEFDHNNNSDSTNNLVIGVVSGTYGGPTLDPNFDCGTGPPDMVVALNAGLYAYESWRSVVDYLFYNPNVVGVFSDYNEYSGVNCAALGGGKSRASLRINPFRQPRAMPVYSMNLPQFSNGFLYVFNEQELK